MFLMLVMLVFRKKYYAVAWNVLMIINMLLFQIIITKIHILTFLFILQIQCKKSFNLIFHKYIQ